MSPYKLKKSTDKKLLEKCHEILVNKDTIFCRIPIHIGIPGNEMVDLQAELSLTLEPTSF